MYLTKMVKKITCIPGDGIGPEIVAEAKKVLLKISEIYGAEFSFEDILMGGASIDVHGVPLTDEAVKTAKSADAVLMGSSLYQGDVLVSPPMEPISTASALFAVLTASSVKGTP